MNWQQKLLGTFANVDIEPYLEFQQYAILSYVERDGKTPEQAGRLLSLDKEQAGKIYKAGLRNLKKNRDLIIADSVDVIESIKECERLENELYALKERIREKIEINKKELENQYNFYSCMNQRYAIKELEDLLNE